MSAGSTQAGGFDFEDVRDFESPFLLEVDDEEDSESLPESDSDVSEFE